MSTGFKATRSRAHSITLAWPFEFDGTPYTELSLRRPNSDDLERVATGKTPAEQAKLSREMIAGLAQIEPKVVGYLDPEDVAQINDWLDPILDPKGQRSGSGGS